MAQQRKSYFKAFLRNTLLTKPPKNGFVSAYGYTQRFSGINPLLLLTIIEAAVSPAVIVITIA